jgi:hypothetical protein
MIFHVHDEPLHVWVEAWTLGHRPALQDAIQLQAKVVVKVPCGVLLDYKRLSTRPSLLSGRFRRAIEAPLLLVFTKSHGPPWLGDRKSR